MPICSGFTQEISSENAEKELSARVFIIHCGKQNKANFFFFNSTVFSPCLFPYLFKRTPFFSSFSFFHMHRFSIWMHCQLQIWIFQIACPGSLYGIRIWSTRFWDWILIEMEVLANLWYSYLQASTHPFFLFCNYVSFMFICIFAAQGYCEFNCWGVNSRWNSWNPQICCIKNTHKYECSGL